LSSPKTIISIEGPTASGKTALSIELAQMLGTEIVSTDSRQCYKEMEIGTAVPSLEERGLVKHHMIHSHSIEQPLNAGTFSIEAKEHINELFKTNQVVVLVGGSPLYAEALLFGLDELPHIDKTIVESTRNRTLEELQQQLKACDPQSSNTIDLMNRRRLERAIQVYEQTGKPISYYLNRPQKKLDFQIKRFRIDWEREELYNRINKRVDLMIDHGLEQEAQRLWAEDNELVKATVGYYEWFNYFEKQCSREEAIAAIKQHSRNFAKRQLTWYRKAREMEVLSNKDSFSQLLERIKG
jgi:tRNA dimethylallyltransferase